MAKSLPSSKTGDNAVNDQTPEQIAAAEKLSSDVATKTNADKQAAPAVTPEDDNKKESDEAGNKLAKTVNAPKTGDGVVDESDKLLSDEAQADGFLPAGEVQVGDSHVFYNTQHWTTRDPYSGAEFPGGQFTDGEYEVNHWIKAQIDSNLLKAKTK